MAIGITALELSLLKKGMSGFMSNDLKPVVTTITVQEFIPQLNDEDSTPDAHPEPQSRCG